MRVVFMGTPEFAATILDDLVEQHDVVAVYTRPDAVRGRGKRLEPSPVKAVAERHGLRVLTPRTLRDEEAQRELAAFEPDVVCVAAYGAILPKAVLDIPRFGCLNVHASLLPRWRGAAPIERAILAGDAEAGVCIMRMEEGLDTGAYCVCRTADVGGKSAAELTDELADLGSHALLTALVHVERGAAEWTEQDEALVTYASKIEKRELDLSPADDAAAAARKVQASGSAHPSRATVAGRGVTVLEARAPEDAVGRELAAGLAPGAVRFAGKRLFLGMADGALEVGALKPDGKQAMDARSFAAGVQGIKDGGLTWEETHA
ncbi:methionyl-tRNA formyltransferase [Eggerthella sp. NSJ-70]|uniref:Methionyl-tRNA formyltransferase n=1 Tax=Eggerthella hominis TaxID=2763043 RepID=A0ABR7BNG9_9ACTN|nr:methionyl-tRNA formyltransferase [Eggerthella hominis]MBC5583139.1 methionyl-tRNA formyltransferase [Eggerthella hominis]